MIRLTHLCAALLTVLLIPALASSALAQERTVAPLADRLPQNVIAYAGWIGLERAAELAEGTHTQALLQQSNLEDFFGRYVPELLERLAQEDPEAARAMEMTREIGQILLRRPSAIGFGGMSDLDGVPRFILLCDAGDDVELLHRRLHELLVQTEQHGLSAFLSRQGSVVRFGRGFDLDALDRLAEGDAEGSLAGAEAFRQTLGRLGERPLVAAYVDFPGLLASAEQALQRFGGEEEQRRAEEMIRVLGARGIGRIGLTAGFDGELYETRAFVGLTGREGLVRLVPDEPLDRQTLAHIPAGSTMVSADRVDLAAMMEVMLDIVAQLDPEAAEQIDEMFAELNERAGVDLQRDLVAHFGSTWAAYVSPRVGSGILSGVLVNRPRDAERLERGMADFSRGLVEQLSGIMREETEGMASLPGRTLEVDGQRLWVLNLPLVAPTWSMDEQAGVIRFGFYPQSILSARMVEGEPFVESEAWQRMVQRLEPDGELISFRYADLPALAPHSYPLILSVSQLGFGFGDVFGEGLGTRPPAMVLPPLARLMEHVEPLGAVTWRDEDGVHFRSLEPFPMSNVLTTDAQSLAMNYASTSIGVMLPALNRAREAANRIQSAHNLLRIAQHAIGYAVDETDDQSLPGSLRELQMSEFRLPMETFVSPRTDTRLPEMMAQSLEVQARWVEENSDYVWAGGGRRMQELMPTTPIAWEKPELVTEGINIAFADGSVRFVEFPRAFEVIRQAPGRAGGREE